MGATGAQQPKNGGFRPARAVKLKGWAEANTEVVVPDKDQKAHLASEFGVLR
jgi:hypothetical protein